MRPSWYTANYCEENVWRLLQDKNVDAGQRHAMFISNARHACPVWQQRSAKEPGEPVLWDYHVVMLGKVSLEWNVFDLDTVLPFPCPALDYLQESFPQHAQLQPEWNPRFRLIDDVTFKRTFASDRSHMNTADGQWSSPPPPFPPIRTPQDPMNLWSFVDMETHFVGHVLSLPELVQALAHGKMLS